MTTCNEFRITADAKLWVEIVDGQYRLHNSADSQLFDSFDELVESLPENLRTAARDSYENWNNS